MRCRCKRASTWRGPNKWPCWQQRPSLAELNTLICATLGLQTVRPERNPLRPEAYIAALRNTVERTPAPAAMRLDFRGLTVMGIALGAELKVLYSSLASRLKSPKA